ncbi:integrase, catalytic region, zinc finger, CCHC-type containing protein [Tanacetum coccineum]
MSNTNSNNMQTQTLSALHNAIMEAGGKDRPPMLAPGNYVKWKSRIKRYIDTKPNHELIHFCLKNPPYQYKLLTTDANATPVTPDNEGKAFANCPPPTYDPKPKVVADDDTSSKEKEIDKLMALISMSFKKIYKPTNNNLKTSSNTRNLNVGNTPRSNRGTRENVGTQVVQQTRIQCYNYKEFGHVARECQKSKRLWDLAYHKEKMLLCKQEEVGIQLSAK